MSYSGPYYRTYRGLRTAADRLAGAVLIVPIGGWLALVAVGRPGLGLVVMVAALAALPAAAALLAWHADRLLARLDADLDAVPDTQARELARQMYARNGKPSNAPGDFERPARLLIARGGLEPPHLAQVAEH